MLAKREQLKLATLVMKRGIVQCEMEETGLMTKADIKQWWLAWASNHISNIGTLMGMEITRQHEQDLQCVPAGPAMTLTNMSSQGLFSRTIHRQKVVKVEMHTSSMADSGLNPAGTNMSARIIPSKEKEGISGPAGTLARPQWMSPAGRRDSARWTGS